MFERTGQRWALHLTLLPLLWSLGANVCLGASSVAVPKAGVYEDFQSVQDGLPSRELPARLKQYTHHVVGFFRSTKVQLYQLDLDRHQARSMGSIFALSDGVQLYLYPSFPSPVKRFSNYVPVEPIGPYLYGTTVAVSNIPSGEGQRAKESLVELLYDTRSGRFSTLNLRNLRAIISDDAELTAQFESERRKRRKLKSYLQQYTSRNASSTSSEQTP